MPGLYIYWLVGWWHIMLKRQQLPPPPAELTPYQTTSLSLGSQSRNEWPALLAFYRKSSPADKNVYLRLHAVSNGDGAD